MKTQYFKQQRSIFRARYNHNTVLHLILVCAIAYIVLQMVYVVLMVLSSSPKTVFSNEIIPNVGLHGIRGFIHRPWTLLTFFWIHAHFWPLLTNMLWLYCFGAVIQTFVGYKEIFTMFAFSSIVAGLGYLILSYFWPFMESRVLLGGLPGVTAFAVGSFVLVPRYRYYLTEHFSIAIWVVMAIFLVLNVLTRINQPATLLLLGFAALSGAAYIQMLKGGFKLGAILYKRLGKIQAIMTPGEGRSAQRHTPRRNQVLKISRHQIQEHPTPEYVDMLLDKISQKGYKSLTEEEKQTLLNASK